MSPSERRIVKALYKRGGESTELALHGIAGSRAVRALVAKGVLRHELRRRRRDGYEVSGSYHLVPSRHRDMSAFVRCFGAWLSVNSTMLAKSAQVSRKGTEGI